MASTICILFKKSQGHEDTSLCFYLFIFFNFCKSLFEPTDGICWGASLCFLLKLFFNLSHLELVYFCQKLCCFLCPLAMVCLLVRSLESQPAAHT